MRARHQLAALCLAVAVPRGARAADFSVDWQAPGCADERTFREQVRHALRRDPEELLTRQLEVRIAIAERSDGDFDLQVATQADAIRFKRELVTPSCEEAVDAAALVVALTLDPNARLSDPESTPAEQQAPRPRKEAPRGLEPYALVLAGISVAEVPAPSPMLTLGVGVQSGRFRAALEGMAIAPQYARAESDAATDARGGEISVLAGGIALCHRALGPTLSLATCVTGQAGIWHSRGVAVANPRSDDELWLAGGGRALALFALSQQLELLAGAELVVLATRPRFYLENIAHVYTPGRWGGRVLAGFDLHF